MRAGALRRAPIRRGCLRILDLAKQEKFRVNLIEAYDQPWKRQLEGTVGDIGDFSIPCGGRSNIRGEAISNYPFWKLQMGCGMALSVLVFGAAWLTLRRRPWTPRLTAWVAVGISATTAGILLGIASDKMFYESYGFGAGFDGRVAGGGDRFAAALRQRADGGARAADFPGTARPRDAGPDRSGHDLGAACW